MTYNPNIPQTGTRIDQTYNLITTNFGQLNTIFDSDHFTWNDAGVSNRGLHRHCTLVSQSAVPSASATAGIVFTQINPASNVNRVDPYYEYDTAGIANGLIPPLIPFKVFCEIAVTNTPTISVSNKYNVGTVSILGNTDANITVNFLNPITTDAPGTFANYLVLLANSGSSTTCTYSQSLRKNNSLRLTVVNITGTISISVGVIQL